MGPKARTLYKSFADKINYLTKQFAQITDNPEVTLQTLRNVPIDQRLDLIDNQGPEFDLVRNEYADIYQELSKYENVDISDRQSESLRERLKQIPKYKFRVGGIINHVGNERIPPNRNRNRAEAAVVARPPPLLVQEEEEEEEQEIIMTEDEFLQKRGMLLFNESADDITPENARDEDARFSLSVLRNNMLENQIELLKIEQFLNLLPSEDEREYFKEVAIGQIRGLNVVELISEKQQIDELSRRNLGAVVRNRSLASLFRTQQERMEFFEQNIAISDFMEAIDTMEERGLMEDIMGAFVEDARQRGRRVNLVLLLQRLRKRQSEYRSNRQVQYAPDREEMMNLINQLPRQERQDELSRLMAQYTTDLQIIHSISEEQFPEDDAAQARVVQTFLTGYSFEEKHEGAANELEKWIEQKNQIGRRRVHANEYIERINEPRTFLYMIQSFWYATMDDAVHGKRDKWFTHTLEIHRQLSIDEIREQYPAISNKEVVALEIDLETLAVRLINTNHFVGPTPIPIRPKIAAKLFKQWLTMGRKQPWFLHLHAVIIEKLQRELFSVPRYKLPLEFNVIDMIRSFRTQVEKSRASRLWIVIADLVFVNHENHNQEEQVQVKTYFLGPEKQVTYATSTDDNPKSLLFQLKKLVLFTTNLHPQIPNPELARAHAYAANLKQGGKIVELKFHLPAEQNHQRQVQNRLRKNVKSFKNRYIVFGVLLNQNLDQIRRFSNVLKEKSNERSQAKKLLKLSEKIENDLTKFMGFSARGQYPFVIFLVWPLYQTKKTVPRIYGNIGDVVLLEQLHQAITNEYKRVFSSHETGDVSRRRLLVLTAAASVDVAGRKKRLIVYERLVDNVPKQNLNRFDEEELRQFAISRFWVPLVQKYGRGGVEGMIVRVRDLWDAEENSLVEFYTDKNWTGPQERGIKKRLERASEYFIST